ncbi:MAG: histidine kinase [Myxococcaceae bacterium]|nr:histidine kinase [Myxococcaceae bacterium]
MKLLPVRRMARLGFALGFLSLNVPMAVRYAFGLIPGQYFVSTLVSIAFELAVCMVVSVWVFEAAERRGFSLRVAGALALLPAVPILVLDYMALWAFAQLVPQWAVLDPTEPKTLAFQVAAGLGDSMPLLVLLVGLLFVPAAVQASLARERELELVRREADLLRLRSHLEPHFVLNTLNAVAGLTSEDPPRAQELLALLGDLFRDAASFSAYHSVDDELRWLSRYVAVHQSRHPDALSVEWRVDDAVRPFRCPALVMQPLVENAIMHGALRAAAGRLVVSAAREGESVVLEVRDNGPALGARRPGGKGVAIVERRLALEGAAPSAFSLQRVGDETVARVVFPMAPLEVTRAA